jgi:hypothetical protein
MMKKILMMCMVSMLFLLASCNAEDSNWAGSFEKAQKLEITSLDGSEVIATMTEKQELTTFVEALKLEGWEMKQVPAEAVEHRKYKLYQPDTITLAESSKGNEELKEVATLTTYENVPYIDLRILGFDTTLSFRIPEEVATYLSEVE